MATERPGEGRRGHGGDSESWGRRREGGACPSLGFLISPFSRRLAAFPVIYRCLGVRSLRNYVPPRPLVNGL